MKIHSGQALVEKSASKWRMSQKAFEVSDDKLYTHVRLHIYPDGGVARLKIYGEPQCNWDKIESGEIRDLR